MEERLAYSRCQVMSVFAHEHHGEQHEQFVKHISEKRVVLIMACGRARMCLILVPLHDMLTIHYDGE
jgi:hypothetical protein